MALAKSWNSVEAKKAKTGEYPEALPTGADSIGDRDVYISWIRDCDARKSHALLLENNQVNDLLKIRALLFRGQLEEAEAIIQKLQGPDVAPEERLEALLEQSRLAAFRGDWQLVHSLSSEAIRSGNLESISYLSALQVHALSCYELGDLLSSIKTLEIAESLATVYPFSISTLYSKVLKARVSARAQSIESGVQLIQQIWQGVRQSGRTPTADSIHAIVFGMIDIAKYSRVMGNKPRSLEKLALISFHMTEAMGEQLYSALASLDATIIGPLEHRGWFLNQLASARREFKRIDLLAQEVLEGKDPSSLSSSTLEALKREALKNGAQKIELNSQSQALLSVNHIVFAEYQWAFQLKPWKAVDLNRHPQILSALTVLSAGNLSKADFFARVWGNARYTSHLHDSSIYYVLNRIKKLTGASFVTRDGIIQANDGVITI